ncbi:hypothetical protein JXE04_02760 [Patescibacteria group bacterium]|nr:hypothetical protein [Patescibacteria group bacterium]
MSFENNVYGNVHPENTYNIENEDRDRHNLEKDNRSRAPHGNKPFIHIEDVEDVEDVEGSESDIYETAENGTEKDEFEFDKFGFVSVLNDYFDQVSQNDKAELFKHINEFLIEYRAILDNSKDEKTALKASSKAFEKIIGTPITGYNAETGKIFFEVDRNKYVKVVDKKAPIDAIKVDYDSNGRPVDPATRKISKNKQLKINKDALEFKGDKEINARNIKTTRAKQGIKLPWRH